MLTQHFEEQTFSKIDFTLRGFESGNYELCQFEQCNFSATDLSGVFFTDCVFKNCNFSLANLDHTALQEVTFIDCKLQGVHFDRCNPFNFRIKVQGGLLDLSSFYKMKLRKTHFKQVSMKEVDLTEADLTESILDDCDLMGAIFDATNLEKADLRTALYYSIDPQRNKIKKAKFSWPALTGLLDRYDIVIA